METSLKYGCNPHQKHALLVDPNEKPVLEFLNGTPGYINLLDALRGWQLVKDLGAASGLPAATSFKHVNPAGVAIAGDLSDEFLSAQFLAKRKYSPLATAYIKARACDRIASFGDFIALSEVVDVSTANIIRREVSDGIIAPGYEDEALEILKKKQGGRYVVIKVDADYTPPEKERRLEFGLWLEQSHDNSEITFDGLGEIVSAKKDLPDEARMTMLVAAIALKYTHSNSIAVGYDGQAIGIGAGQQSRIACTRLACGKADRYFLSLHPMVQSLPFKEKTSRNDKFNAIDAFLRFEDLDHLEMKALTDVLTEIPTPLSADEKSAWIEGFENVGLSSDGFIPFRDNIDRAAQSGVRYIVQPGGSRADEGVTKAADERGLVMLHSGIRLFVH